MEMTFTPRISKPHSLTLKVDENTLHEITRLAEENQTTVSDILRTIVTASLLKQSVRKPKTEEKSLTLPPNEVFLYWEEIITPITRNRSIEQKATEKLLTEYGGDNCKKIIRAVALALTDQYARKEVKCSKPSQLLKNWDEVVVYLKSKVTQEVNRPRPQA